MRRPHAALALVVAVLLAACGSAAAPSSSPSAEPFDAQGSWQLTAGRADGAEIPILDDHPITLTVEGSEIGSTSACNTYGGRLSVTDGRLRITDLGMTMMGCEEPVMASEAAYMAALGEVESIGGDGDELVLRGQNLELRFAALAPAPTADVFGTAWVLETVFVGDVASSTIGEPATLQLRSDGTFSGSTGCRSFTGSWVEEGEQILAPTLTMDGTECPAVLSRQDDNVVSVVADGFIPSVAGNLLTLTEPGGVGLVYRAED